MAKITGRVEILVNGNSLLNKAGATASGIGISGKMPVELEPVVGDTGIHGFKETPKYAQCDVPITDRDDVLLSDLAKIFENGTVIFRAINGGKVYTMNKATCLSNFKVKAGEGEVENMRFVGPYWVETTDTVI